LKNIYVEIKLKICKSLLKMFKKSLFILSVLILKSEVLGLDKYLAFANLNTNQGR